MPVHTNDLKTVKFQLPEHLKGDKSEISGTQKFMDNFKSILENNPGTHNEHCVLLVKAFVARASGHVNAPMDACLGQFLIATCKPPVPRLIS